MTVYTYDRFFLKGIFMNKKKTERVFSRVDSLKHFSEKITEFGEKSAFLWHDAAHQPLEMSYNELSAKIKALAAGFASLGFKDSKIAIIGETSPLWVATYVAAIASGNVAIPMDKELQVEEIEGFLEFAEADAIVFSAGFNEKFAHAVIRRVCKKRRKIKRQGSVRNARNTLTRRQNRSFIKHRQYMKQNVCVSTQNPRRVAP